MIGFFLSFLKFFSLPKTKQYEYKSLHGISVCNFAGLSFLCEENFLNFYFLSSKSLMLVGDCLLH